MFISGIKKIFGLLMCLIYAIMYIMEETMEDSALQKGVETILLNLIIVEDMQVTRNGLCTSVPWEELGFRLVADFADGEQALDYIRNHMVDVVLSDIRMEKMDGLTLCERIAACSPQTHVVLLSAYGEFEYAQQAIKLHVDRYLLKPVRVQELIREFRALAAEWTGLEESSASVIETTLQHIRSHYAEPLTLEMVSNMVHVSKNYLSTAFKQEMGIGFNRYLTQIRIEQAKKILLDGGNVSDAAYAVGFSDPQYFANVFKKETGMTASEYKRKKTHEPKDT